MKRITYSDELAAAYTWNGQARLANDVIAEAESEITDLDTRVRAMARELVQLRTIVTVLVGTLRDLNVVDAHVLDVRMQAAFEEALGPTPPVGSTEVTCPRCKQLVARAQTTMTGDGVLCDRCAGA